MPLPSVTMLSTCRNGPEATSKSKSVGSRLLVNLTTVYQRLHRQMAAFLLLMPCNDHHPPASACAGM